MDAVATQDVLDFSALDFDAIGPPCQGLQVIRVGPARDEVFQVEGDVEQLVQQSQAGALLALHVLPELLVGPLRVGGEGVEAVLQGVSGAD